MSHAVSAHAAVPHQPASTILSDQVLIPITCSHCRKDTDVSLKLLKQHSPILCEHCYEVHPFSAAELQLARRFLAKAGFHFSA